MGGQFATDYAQRVTADGESALYDPDWSGGTASFANLAYAVYRFNLAGYSGEQSLTLQWPTAPADLTQVWIGFSNWGADRWDWIPGPDVTGKLLLAVPGFMPFTKKGDPGTGDMLVAVVVLGSGQSTLASLTITTPPPPSGWTHSWGDSTYEEFLGLTLDNANNVVTCGDLNQVTGVAYENAVVLKFAPDYSFQWGRGWRHDLDSMFWDVANDASNNLYAVGIEFKFFAGAIDASRLIIVKYDESGAILWQKGMNCDITSAMSEGRSIVIDGSGNPWFTGRSSLFFGDEQCHPVVVKLGADGQVNWVKQEVLTLPQGIGLDLALAPDNAVVLLATGGESVNDTLLVAKFDAEGNTIWERLLGPYESVMDRGAATVDADGNVYICASTLKDRPDYDGFVVKLDAAGNLVWQTGWDLDAAQLAQGIAIGQDGEVHIVGETTSPNNRPFSVRLTPQGSIRAVYSATVLNIGSFTNIAVNKAGQLYFCGESGNASLAWTTSTYSVSNPALTLSNPGDTFQVAIGGRMDDLDGESFEPQGVLDTGGGVTDGLIGQYLP